MEMIPNDYKLESTRIQKAGTGGWCILANAWLFVVIKLWYLVVISGAVQWNKTTGTNRDLVLSYLNLIWPLTSVPQNNYLLICCG